METVQERSSDTGAWISENKKPQTDKEGKRKQDVGKVFWGETGNRTTDRKLF